MTVESDLRVVSNLIGALFPEFRVVVVVFLTLTDPLRIQPWSQDGRNQTNQTGNRR